MYVRIYKYRRVWHLERSTLLEYDDTKTIEVEDGSTIEPTATGAILRLPKSTTHPKGILITATALYQLATRTPIDTEPPPG